MGSDRRIQECRNPTAHKRTDSELTFEVIPETRECRRTLTESRTIAKLGPGISGKDRTEGEVIEGLEAPTPGRAPVSPGKARGETAGMAVGQARDFAVVLDIIDLLLTFHGPMWTMKGLVLIQREHGGPSANEGKVGFVAQL